MKKIENYFLAVSMFLLLCSACFAQQDYQIVQNFKAKQMQIQDAIKNSQSLDDLNSAQSQIDQIKLEFAGNKNLLDKSLYPDDLNGSIDKLNNSLTTRSEDFTQISTLKVQVTQIQSQLDSLNTKNADLLSQIQQMKESNSKDVSKLSSDIRELRSSLAKRDKIIMSMLSGMLPSSSMENGNLTNSEKQQLYSETKKANVIANIKKAIDDNIKFLSVTNLTPADLNSMKKQQAEFENIWHNVGPSIADIYSEKKDNTQSVNDVDAVFANWNNTMDQVAWKSIRQKFSDNGIALNNFSNGDEFVQAMNSYIDDEIKNSKANGSDAKTLYSVFADSVWSNQIRPAWIPYLVSNKLLTNADDDRIEAKIDQWKDTLFQTNYTWLYIILGVLALIIIVSLVKAFSSKKKRVSQSMAHQ